MEKLEINGKTYSGSLISKDEDRSLALKLGHTHSITDKLRVQRAAQTTVGGDEGGKNLVVLSLLSGGLGELVDDGLDVLEEVRVMLGTSDGSHELSLSDELHSTGNLFDGLNGVTTDTHYKIPTK